MRRTWLVLLVIGAFGVFVSSAVAGNVHFKSGGGPFSAVSGGSGETLTVNGTLVGLGVAPGTIDLNAFGTISTDCTNHGTHFVPAQSNPNAPIASGSVAINPDDITKSGNYTFSVSGTASGGDCPNANWTKTITVTFTSYTLTVTQGSKVTNLGPFSV